MAYIDFAKQFATHVIRQIDPRVVRLKKPRRFPKWVAGTGVATVFLIVGAAAVAAAVPDEIDPSGTSSKSFALKPSPNQTIQTLIETEAKAQNVRATPAIGPDSLPESEPVPKVSEFYDPVYVFFENEVERITAYPLASPPGIVVDLMGTPEPGEGALEMIGRDERIRSIKRRLTERGFRYIIGLSTPIKRVELFREGSVAMIFPVE